MRKRFQFLFSAVLMTMAGLLPAHAQFDAAANGFDPDSKLITNGTQLSSNASDEDEGKHIDWLIDDDINTFWHSDWHGKVSGEHYVQVDLNEETTGFYQFVFGRRSNESSGQCISMQVEESNDGKTWTAVKLQDMPWNGDQDRGAYVVSDIFRIKDCNHLRFTSKLTNTNYGKFWHCAELQVYPADEGEALADAINTLLFQYDKYMPGYPEELSIGTAFGQYTDAEAYRAFQEDIALAMQYADRLDNGETIPVDDILAVVNKTEEDFAAVMASLVTFSMDEGYYRIVGNLKYYNDVETGDIDIDGNPVTERQYYDIAMSCSLDGWCLWNARDEADACQLWKLGMEGKDVRMVNAATGMQCTDVVDNNIPMSETDGKLMGFDYVATSNGHDVIYIRFADSSPDYEATGSTYFHQLNHGKGTGKGPQKICMWQATWNKGVEYLDDKGTSEWYLERVSDEEAMELLDGFEMVKNHDKLVRGYQDYIDKAKAGLDVAYDLRNTYAPDTDAPVIESTSQFHSLWTEPNEGSLDNLLDGDGNTYWHSRWSSAKATGPHQASLDVTLDKPVTGMFQLYVVRRISGRDDHITRMSLYGSNDDNSLNEEQDTNWELVCDNVSTPWSNGQKDVYSQPFRINKEYKHLRFYEEDANGINNWHYTGCCHYATFQIYPAEKILPSQFDAMGEVGTTLEAIVNAYPAMDMETLTIEDYNALVKAYEDFAAILVDPQELRNAIGSNKNYPDYVIVGDAPGYWTSQEPAEALEKILAAADEYDKAGRYTKEESDRFVSGIKAARENIFATAIKVDTGKWYHFRFDSEDNFDLNGWNKNETANGVLFGQRVAAGERPEDIGYVLPTENIVPGTHLYYFNDNEVSNEEASQFRFVPLNDSTYAIQNRASGLYINRRALNENGGISLQWTPSPFTVKPIGYGQNILYMTDIDGTPVRYPHLNAWAADYSLVGTWDDSHPGCNSHYLIEPVEDVDPDTYNPVMAVECLIGGITPLCYTSDITTEYSYAYLPLGCFRNEDDEAFLALKNAEGHVDAGVPFFLIPDGVYDGETKETVVLYPGSSMTSEPGSAGGVTGAFKDTWIGTGYVYFNGNETKSVEGTDTGRNYCVLTNSAYLAFGDVMIEDDAEYDIAIQINGKFNDWTGIERAVGNVSREGAVYSISGQLVKEKATLRDIRSMGRGIYIINGTKVLVR